MVTHVGDLDNCESTGTILHCAKEKYHEHSCNKVPHREGAHTKVFIVRGPKSGRFFVQQVVSDHHSLEFNPLSASPIDRVFASNALSSSGGRPLVVRE